jgi:hypothetical protein
MRKYQFLGIFFLCFELLVAQSNDNIYSKDSLSNLYQLSRKFSLPKTEIDISIDRSDFWIGMNYNANVTKKINLQPSVELAIVKTFFQRNITPRLGLGFSWSYVQYRKYGFVDISDRPPSREYKLKRFFDLSLDAGITQTISRFGSQIQNETQFYIGHQIDFGKKRMFVIRFRGAMASRQISGNSISPIYFNFISTLGIRCFGY